ncbi:hypothetical protein EDD22DRAFT_953830 [Suillus occidentalis]|nr:hypothetical protein EDD22DRAFT_953830 [Suillus occidentalis]
MGIIASALHILACTGEAHNVLTKQATTLLGTSSRSMRKGITSLELLLPTQRASEGRFHDSLGVSRHIWHNKICTWEALGDNSCDLSVIPNPSTSPLTVNLPSPSPSLASVLPSPSGKTTSKFQDKEKVSEVVLLQSFIIVKQNFGPASMTANSHPEVMKSPIRCSEATVTTSGSHPEVIEPSNDTSIASDGEPPAIPTFDITISGPNNPAIIASRNSGSCATKKIRCQPASLGTPPKYIRSKSTTLQMHSKTPAPTPSTTPSAL